MGGTNRPGLKFGQVRRVYFGGGGKNLLSMIGDATVKTAGIAQHHQNQRAIIDTQKQREEDRVKKEAAAQQKAIFESEKKLSKSKIDLSLSQLKTKYTEIESGLEDEDYRNYQGVIDELNPSAEEMRENLMSLAVDEEQMNYITREYGEITGGFKNRLFKQYTDINTRDEQYNVQLTVKSLGENLLDDAGNYYTDPETFNATQKKFMEGIEYAQRTGAMTGNQAATAIEDARRGTAFAILENDMNTILDGGQPLKLQVKTLEGFRDGLNKQTVGENGRYFGRENYLTDMKGKVDTKIKQLKAQIKTEKEKTAIQLEREKGLKINDPVQYSIKDQNLVLSEENRDDILTGAYNARNGKNFTNIFDAASDAEKNGGILEFYSPDSSLNGGRVKAELEEAGSRSEQYAIATREKDFYTSGKGGFIEDSWGDDFVKKTGGYVDKYQLKALETPGVSSKFRGYDLEINDPKNPYRGILQKEDGGTAEAVINVMDDEIGFYTPEATKELGEKVLMVSEVVNSTPDQTEGFNKEVSKAITMEYLKRNPSSVVEDKGYYYTQTGLDVSLDIQEQYKKNKDFRKVADDIMNTYYDVYFGDTPIRGTKESAFVVNKKFKDIPEATYQDIEDNTREKRLFVENNGELVELTGRQKKRITLNTGDKGESLAIGYEGGRVYTSQGEPMTVELKKYLGR